MERRFDSSVRQRIAIPVLQPASLQPRLLHPSGRQLYIKNQQEWRSDSSVRQRRAIPVLQPAPLQPHLLHPSGRQLYIKNQQECPAGFGFPHPPPPSHPSMSLNQEWRCDSSVQRRIAIPVLQPAPLQPHLLHPSGRQLYIKNPQGSSSLAFDLRSLNQNFTENVTLPSPYPPAGKAEAGAKYPCGFDAGTVPMKTPIKVAQPCNAYKNSSSPRGIVVIFNYIFKNNKLRKGARKDHENLQANFQKIGYDVWPPYIDLTRQETLNKLDEVRKSPELKKVDSLITVFLSHGGQSENEFMTFDEETISVDEILHTKFTDQQCPFMKGKPKLFIFNYCRGQVVPSNQVQYDSFNPSTDIHEAPSDVAIIQATLPHFKAGRYSDTGTIFVSEFCKVLEQNSGSMELAEIIYETSKQMRKDTLGNTPTVTPIHFGKFKFM